MKKNPLYIAMVVAALFLSFQLTAKDKAVSTESFNQQQAPISFIENKGQITDQDRKPRHDIQFSIKATGGLTIFIGNGAIHYQFSKNEGQSASHTASLQPRGLSKTNAPVEPTTTTLYRMDVELLGANKNAEVVTGSKLAYTENYFTAATAAQKGATVNTYNTITYKNVYPHIDWTFYIKDGQMKHEFIVGAGGKVADIKLKYGGATKLQLNDDGSLTAVTPMGSVTEQAPISYQADHKQISSSFTLSGNTLGYATDSYSGTLIIDPTLQWATYFGGIGDEFAGDITSDKFGNLYLTGRTNSITGLATTGAYQLSMTGTNDDAFIAKFNNAGVLQWSTYYGDVGSEEGHGIATDDSGNVFVTGYTTSIDNIATPGAWRTFSYGSTDVFLAKFTSAGTIVWATFFGGIGYDYSYDIALDTSGNIFITGFTSSDYFFSTAGAYQTTIGSDHQDGFLARFNASGFLQWSTYFGGDHNDGALGIAIDGLGSVYICGGSSSTSGIATAGSYQPINAGGNDVFLAKFTVAGTIQWCTYLGGSTHDEAVGITTDTVGNIYICGYAGSTTGITTPGAYQTVFGGGDNDAILAKFNTSGSLMWATYYGGAGADGPASVLHDRAGNIYLYGGTGSLTGITTPGSLQPVYRGSGDAYLVQFNSAGFRTYGTYFGGSAGDGAAAATIDTMGRVYICGSTYSTAGITTSGAYQPASAGGYDSYLARYNFCATPVMAAVAGPASVCVADTIHLTNSVAGGSWSVLNNTASISITGKVTGLTAGADTVIYAVSNTCGTDTVKRLITVLALPDAGSISGRDSLCIGDVALIAPTTSGGLWSTTTGHASVLPTGVVTGATAGTDIIVYTVTNSCGTDTSQKPIRIVDCHVGIDAVSSSSEGVNFYPNPAHNGITISSPFVIKNIAIRNAIGQLVFAETYDRREVAVSLEQLPAGVYIFTVNGSLVYKVVKE